MGRTSSRHKEADKCLQNSSPKTRWEEISDVEGVAIQSSILCYVTPCILVDKSRCFRGSYWGAGIFETSVLQDYTTSLLGSRDDWLSWRGSNKYISVKFCMRILTG